jgi:hypothetical protein
MRKKKTNIQINHFLKIKKNQKINLMPAAMMNKIKQKYHLISFLLKINNMTFQMIMKEDNQFKVKNTCKFQSMFNSKASISFINKSSLEYNHYLR